ncbi:Uma2 family endonuclease [Rhizobium sp. Kim5]|uniref:Uma2 family endonuclease n=1 Tax=Rhizobium sp. Kim5 TaxID=2020311 RepID=UPI000A337769|nr:Uma2 family endonuclease [Rhizobium sp. Kim5]
MAVDEFLAWEADQPLRFEFLDGQPLPVEPSTQARSVLISDIVSLLRPAVRGTGLRVLSNFRIRHADDVRYPAVIIDGGSYDPNATLPSQPFAIVDVDRFRDWSALPGVRYLALDTGDDPNGVLTLLPKRTN